MVLQVAFLGGCVLANGAEELARVDVQLHMLFEVAAVGRLVLAVRAAQRLRPVMHLTRVTSHLVLIGCQVATAVTLKRPFT